MTLQEQFVRAWPKATEEATGVVLREDARWARPIFRPPPLTVNPARPQIAYSDTIHRTELMAPLARASSEPR